MSSAAPLFSLIIPVGNPSSRFLRATVESVQAQTYDDYELLLADEYAAEPEILATLADAARTDARIKVIRRADDAGASAASNAAVAVASGEFIALLDAGDLLDPRALETMREAIEREPEVDCLYSDEEYISETGGRRSLIEKPEWSPERLRHQNYVRHLSVLRTSLVRAVGGCDSTYGGAQSYDLILKVSERARRVVYVPKVLYRHRIASEPTAHDGAVDSDAWSNGVRAVQAHLGRLGIVAEVGLGVSEGTYTITRSIPADLRVSIVIPTRGTTGVVWGKNRCFVVDAVRSALERAGHASVQVVVVYDQDTRAEVLTELAAIVPGADLVLLPYDDEFNFSRKCNLGVLASDGDVVVLLNDDTQARSEGWLVQLVAPLLESDVGMTGAKLLFEDGTLQHGGHVQARREYPHAFIGASEGELGYDASLVVNRECSGVTSACAALRRETFVEVGGLCEHLPGNFNDVDLSNKIAVAGYRMLWMAHVVLYHFESKSRDPRVTKAEIGFVRARWGIPYQRRDRFLPVWT